MDIEKEVFNMVYNSVDKLSAIGTPLFTYQSLYFAEGHGEMKMLDWRVGNVPNSYSLHEKRINSIDFNPQKPYMVSTSSNDCTAKVFDLRKMKTSNNESLVTMQHKKAVYCAYFSPSGNYLATTRFVLVKLFLVDRTTGRNWYISFLRTLLNLKALNHFHALLKTHVYI